MSPPPDLLFLIPLILIVSSSLPLVPFSSMKPTWSERRVEAWNIFCKEIHWFLESDFIRSLIYIIFPPLTELIECSSCPSKFTLLTEIHFLVPGIQYNLVLKRILWTLWCKAGLNINVYWIWLLKILEIYIFIWAFFYK